MFKLVVLSVLLTVAAARPGYLESSPVVYSSPIVHGHSYSSPIVHDHSYGSYVKALPSTISHHSSSVIHDSTHYVEPIVAPVVKTYASPIVKSYASPIVKSVYSPISSYGSPIHHSYSAPAHYEYLESAPHYSLHGSTPSHYSYGHSSPFSYASSCTSSEVVQLSTSVVKSISNSFVLLSTQTSLNKPKQNQKIFKMFKLVVLFAFLAVAAARPGLYHEASPVVYSAPIVQEHSLAKVGAIVKSVPTAVSHQSSTVVHNSAHVVQPIVAPVVKTYAAAPVIHSAPLVQTYSALAAPAHLSYAAASPYALHSAPISLHSAPVAYGHGW
ncbi:uncharacterized protein LOC129909339 [Episyrphus balteatus]|uniref:uncharacterized protein LOC129909339 n=1 Tax=Episyrphus balteatus TaxID=286459 RepID=UPI0024865FAC|nr:uncharacterized protein LOC129909339 [Episyrphus balteatus]